MPALREEGIVYAVIVQWLPNTNIIPLMEAADRLCAVTSLMQGEENFEE